jgi:hypothetical protein
VRASTWAAEITFAPNRITPPIWPARARASRLALGVVPCIRTISFCPISWAKVGVVVAVVGVVLGAGDGLGCGATGLGFGVGFGDGIGKADGDGAADVCAG